MPLYVGDYLADTVHLTGHESGAYLHLLMCMWRSNGRLPNDHEKLARYCKLTRAQWDRVAPAVMQFFDVFGDHLVNRRLTAEFQKYEVALASRIERASAGGKAKALKDKGLVVLEAELSTDQAGLKRANQNQKEERKTPTVSKERGSRLPDSWALSEADMSFARAHGVADVEGMGEAFADWWRAQPGQKGVKLDWPATWRTWVRNDRNRRASKPERREAWT